MLQQVRNNAETLIQIAHGEMEWRIKYVKLAMPKNYTMTNFADYADNLNHDEINRYLKSSKLRPLKVKMVILYSITQLLIRIVLIKLNRLEGSIAAMLTALSKELALSPAFMLTQN